MRFGFVVDLIALAFAAGSIALRRWGDPRRRARRALKGIEETRVCDLEDGTRARATGIVAAEREPWTSLADRRPCVGFRLVVEEEDRSRGSSGWRTILIREECEPFSIADETGRAEVAGPFTIGLDPDDAAWTNLPSSLYQLLDEAKVAWDPARNLRFREALLKVGDRVTVFGNVSVDVHPGGDRRGLRDPPMRARISGAPSAPVLLLDADDLAHT